MIEKGFLCLPLFAQEVHIPDPNLRAAIKDELRIPHGSLITHEDIQHLTHLTAYNRGIVDLSGLDAATNLEDLALGQNVLTRLFH